MITGFEKIVEERIKQSQKKGDFDNLAGFGKPLFIEDISRIPEDLHLAYKILKNADCVPPEIEIKKEIHATEALLENMRDEKLKYKALKKLNYLILKLNTLRKGAVAFEIPQKYEERVVDCLVSNTDKECQWLRKKSTFCVALHPSFLQSTKSTYHHSGFARLANFIRLVELFSLPSKSDFLRVYQCLRKKVK